MGQYNPKYNATFETSPKWGMGRSKRQSQFEFGSTMFSSDELASSADYPKTKVKGAVKFRSQLAHVRLPCCDPNERRFEPFNDNPQVWSNCRLQKLVAMGKPKGRSGLFLSASISPGQYNPNLDPVKERIRRALDLNRDHERSGEICEDVAATEPVLGQVPVREELGKPGEADPVLLCALPGQEHSFFQQVVRELGLGDAAILLCKMVTCITCGGRTCTTTLGRCCGWENWKIWSRRSGRAC